MKELSVFIDESGDFGVTENKSPYYLVTLVFHDQQEIIIPHIKRLEESLETSNHDYTFIHSGPLIRREDDYRNLCIDERRNLFYKMRTFYMHAPINHHTIIVNKNHITNYFKLNAQLAKMMAHLIKENLVFFQSYDKIIVYYDNGQQELNMVINTVLSIHLNNVEFRKANQEKYRLLQLADFICTLELLKIKFDEKRLSKSETNFFYKPQELKKTFLKILERRKL